MNKIIKIASAITLVGLLPFAALASNGQNSGQSFGVRMQGLLGIHQPLELKTGKAGADNDNDADDNGPKLQNHFSGAVTAVFTGNFTLKAKSGTVYTVNTANAKIVEAFGVTVQPPYITVNDNVEVTGVLSGSVIDASHIVVTPANTHKAEGSGTVTSVNGNSFTLQLNNHGIISSATVNTSPSTTVITQNGATTTVSSITVGAKVSVKGLWDELLNVLNAIKIRIHT